MSEIYLRKTEGKRGLGKWEKKRLLASFMGCPRKVWQAAKCAQQKLGAYRCVLYEIIQKNVKENSKVRKVVNQGHNIEKQEREKKRKKSEIVTGPEGD